MFIGLAHICIQMCMVKKAKLKANMQSYSIQNSMLLLYGVSRVVGDNDDYYGSVSIVYVFSI